MLYLFVLFWCFKSPRRARVCDYLRSESTIRSCCPGSVLDEFHPCNPFLDLSSPRLVPGIDVYSTYFVIEESPREDSTRGRASTVPGEASLSFGLKPAMHNDPVH